MPRVVVNLPEWLASRWHPYATLISALQAAREGIKIAFEDCFSCSSERLSVAEKIWTAFFFFSFFLFCEAGVRLLRDSLKHLKMAALAAISWYCLHANEINTVCQSERLPKGVVFQG